MNSALLVHRLHFAFTVTFHYLFPQLTMGLAPLIVVLKTMALRYKNETYNQSARFWARIFGINFVLGVVTGIPMEFQFGTNWSHFSRYAGGVIGQTLAMEGMFAFFLESAFLGLFLFGEKRLSPRAHWWSAVAVFVGAWLSGYFIIATDAWMQNPVGYERAGGAARYHRAAQRGGAQDRQSDPRSQDAQLSYLPSLGSGGAGTGCVSAKCLAGQYSALVLQLSHHGRTGNSFHRHYANRSFPSVARKAVWHAMDALGSHAKPALSLHCQHRGLDDCRNRSPAMAGLWLVQNCR